MSLFIGKDINNKSVFHLTSTAHTETEMKSGILGDTVLNTLNPITTYEFINVNGNAKFHSYYFVGSTFSFSNASLLGTLPIQQIYYLDSNNRVIHIPGNFQPTWSDTSNLQADPVDIYGGAVPKYSSRFPYFAIYNTQKGYYTFPNFPLAKMCVVYNKTYGYNSLISVTNTQFTIGNIDLYNFKYIFPGTLVTNSNFPQIDATTQLINTSLLSGNLSIETVGTAITIKKGTVPILSNAADVQFSLVSSTPYDVTPGHSTTTYIAGLSASYIYSITITGNFYLDYSIIVNSKISGVKVNYGNYIIYSDSSYPNLFVGEITSNTFSIQTGLYETGPLHIVIDAYA